MINWNKLFWGDSRRFPSTRQAASEDIPPSSWTLGQLWLGRPATGKTAACARCTIDHLIAHPREAMISFDGSQAFTDTFLKIVLSQPPHIKEALKKRIIYDELGHPKFTMTLPEFHVDYDVPMEKQITRAVQNFAALNPQLMTQTPIMGGASVTDYGTMLFRLLSVIPNEYKSTWQLTEGKWLLKDKAIL